MGHVGVGAAGCRLGHGAPGHSRSSQAQKAGRGGHGTPTPHSLPGLEEVVAAP